MLKSLSTHRRLYTTGRAVVVVACLVIVGTAIAIAFGLLSAKRPIPLNNVREEKVATQQEGQPPLFEVNAMNGGGAQRNRSKAERAGAGETAAPPRSSSRPANSAVAKAGLRAVRSENRAEQVEADLDDDKPGYDDPSGALRFRRLQLQDEKGAIPPDGLQKAREHVARMKAAHEERLKARQQAGLPTEDLDGGGIEPGSWDRLGPGNIGGRIRAIVIHPTEPHRIWIGSVSGGIWRTSDGGGSWEPVNDFMANLSVTSIVMHPADPNIMYAGTGEGFGNIDALQGAGIFKSTDGGQTWNQLPSTANPNFFFVNRLAISANGNTILAATSQAVDVNNVLIATGGVQRSTDGGATWSQRTNTPAFDIDFLGPNNLKAVVGELGSARYSLDGGVNWTVSTFSPPISNGGTAQTDGRVEFAVHKTFQFDSFVYAGVNQNDGDVYRSNNSGVSFTRYSTGTNYLGGQGWYNNIIWSNPQDPDNVIVGGIFLWRGTIDFNTNTLTLNPISDGSNSPHADNHVVVEHPGYDNATNRIVFIGNDGGIYRTDDVTTATIDSGWTELNNTLDITQFYGAAVQHSSGVVIGGAQDNGTLRFSGNTEDWKEMFGGDGGFCAVDQTDPNYVYGEYIRLRIHRSTDGGLTSSYIDAGLGDANNCPTPTTCRANFIAPFIIDPIDPNTLLAGGASLWRSQDVKETTPTWAAIKNPATGNSPISAIAVSPLTSTLVLVGHNSGEIYRTFNGTGDPGTVINSWQRIDTVTTPARMVTRLVIDPNHSTNWYYATFGGFSNDNVWRSTDSGTTWEDVSGTGATSLPSVPVRTLVVHPLNPSFLYVGTEIGIFVSEDGGATWLLPQDGPANVSVDELFFRPDNTLYAATHGRGIYRTSTPVFVPPQVTNTSDSGAGSLRDAITRTSFVTATERKIIFNIAGGGVQTINVTTSLPTLSNIKLDGWSQAGTGYTGPPLIEINGAGAVGGGGAPVDGLTINESEVCGLAINRFSGAGIKIANGAGNSVVRGCYIGTNAAGTAAAGNAIGIHIFLTSNNRIGRQTFANERNLISGNTQVGVLIAGLSGQFATGNRVQGNMIGTDVTGNARLANLLDGVRITDSPSNTIGGTHPLYGNIISGNGVSSFGADGIEITGTTSSGNMILGNYIGLAANGNGALGNLGSGVRIDNAPGTIIGGTADGARNVIVDNRNQGGIALINPGSSGTNIQGNYVGTNAAGNVAIPHNAYGVYVESGNNTIGGGVANAGNLIVSGIGIYVAFGGTAGTTIQGNMIGTNAAGTAALNSTNTGIDVRSTNNILIGGANAGERNIISGNFTGLSIVSSSNVRVQGNYIGTNPAGTAALPNVTGVIVDGGANNRIGGDTAGAGNVISGNGTGGNDHGIRLANTSGAIVQGNRIGTNAAGTARMGNGGHGVQVFNSTNCTIGGVTAAARNIISANGYNGIIITSSNGTTVQNNYIGTDITGTANLGNGQQTGDSGVVISFANNNVIGGAGVGNMIANSGCFCFGQNRGNGVLIFSGTGNRIEGNSIFNNAELGIDLSGGAEGANRVTPNDNCDADTGPNNLQNFPVLTSATSSGTSVTLAGSLNSTPSTTYRLEIFANTTCDASGNGEGQTYLGFTTVTTDASCNASFNITFNAAVPVGRFITATATDHSGNTSEFSGCVPVACGYAVSPASQFFPMNGGSGSLNVLTGGSACAWSAVASDDWITITSADSGSGNETITFEVRENFTASARQGSINAGGQVLTIVQDGGLGDDCGYLVSPTFNSHPASGGGGIINVTAAERCGWQAVSDVGWVTITSTSVGIGNATVSYSVGVNPTPAGRKGTITIAGQVFSVKQKGG